MNGSSLNPLPKDKILDWSKLKAFADDKINVNEIQKFRLGRVENTITVEKGEIAGFQHFLLFPKCFRKASFSRSLNSSTLYTQSRLSRILKKRERKKKTF